jgi:hypothetical protein
MVVPMRPRLRFLHPWTRDMRAARPDGDSRTDIFAMRLGFDF